MKSLTLLLLTSLMSVSALAGEYYGCIGVDEKKQEVTIDIAFETVEEAIVTDMEGTEINLSLNSRTKKGTVYADYGYDGYGGFVELILPKNFDISGPNAAEEFKAKFVIETFSELGHVYTTTFAGECERQDN